jgi:hypothetical protein
MTNVARAVMFTSKCWYIHGHLLGIPHTIHPLFPILYLFMYDFLSDISFISEYNGGPGSAVDIATDYGLEGPGIDSRWRRDFLHLSRPALGPIQPPVQ